MKEPLISSNTYWSSEGYQLLLLSARFVVNGIKTDLVRIAVVSQSSIHKSFAFKPNKQRHEWVTYKLKLLIICKKLLLREVSKYGVFSGPYYPALDTFYAVCFQCSILKVGTNHSSCTTGLRSEIFNVAQLYKWSTTRFKFKCKTF